jgi:putative flippase GtrA
LIEVRHRGSALAKAGAIQPIGRGRHRKPSLISRVASEHGRRLTSFSLIGFGVFALGICFQALVVRLMHVPAVSAYVIQVVLSVQANFVANLRWTWSDRNAPFWRSCLRYNVKRAAGTLLSLALYPLLIKLGMNYLIANGVLVVLLTPANYVLGHWWTFAARNPRVPGIKLDEAPPARRADSRGFLVQTSGQGGGVGVGAAQDHGDAFSVPGLVGAGEQGGEGRGAAVFHGQAVPVP